MKNGVGQPDKHHRQQHCRIGRRETETEIGEARDQQPEHQHPARADPVDQIADRQLRGDPDDAGGRQCETQLDKTDAELRLQEREQRRQHEMLEMVDEMGCGDQADRLVLGAFFAALAARQDRLRHAHPNHTARRLKIRMLTV